MGSREKNRKSRTYTSGHCLRLFFSLRTSAAFLLGNGDPVLEAEGGAKRRRDGVANLAVLLLDAPDKLGRVREALGPGALANAQDAVLVVVDDASLLGHRLRRREDRAKDAVLADAAVQAGPLAVRLAVVRQAPRDDGGPLPVGHEVKIN